MSLMPFTLDLRLWRWQVPGGDKLAAPARWRRHAVIARCRCRLQRSPRLSGRNPSSLSVSPPRARSSPLSVSIGICPYGPPTGFRAWVAAQKRRHAGVEGKQRQRKILGFMRSGRQQGIEMVSMRQQITPLCFAS